MSALYLSREDAVKIAMNYIFQFGDCSLNFDEIRELIANDMEQKCYITNDLSGLSSYKEGYSKALCDIETLIRFYHFRPCDLETMARYYRSRDNSK